MTEPSKAAFLSYASQDAEAARRICEALRTAGIEIWLDQSELRGGDAWDRQIRKQIHDCALFIPIISSNTQERSEGYFRLEWKLAVERTHLMSDRIAFLVPVVIDATGDAEADVPDAFRAVQWTRLPGGHTPPSVCQHFAALVEGAQTRSPAALIRKPRPPASRPRLVALGIAIAIAITIVIVAAVAFKPFRSVTPSPTAVPAAPLAVALANLIPEKSIAVLPFADMSENKDQEYFSDGLSEELIDMLSKVHDLRVPARTSSFYFKGKNASVESIATQLKVANLLEGSVRKAGDRLRITAQLIRADSGYHLWSETYDREAKDIFKVQDEIATAVVEALKAKLAPSQTLASSRTSNPEAYNQYLLGRQYFNRGNFDDLRLAIGAYNKAIAIDPSFGAAYGGLAMAETYAAGWTDESAGLKRAAAAAEKAIALAPGEADGFAARGALRRLFSFDWTGAQTDLERALMINPADSTAQSQYSSLLGNLGRLSDAISAARKAVEFDPLSSGAWSTLGLYLAESADYPAAHDALRRSLEIHPDSVNALFNLGALQLHEGNAAEALVTFRKITDNVYKLTGISMAEHALGHAQESQQAVDEIIATEAQNSAYQIAEVFAWRRDDDKALRWLERAYEQRDGGMSRINSDPLLTSLRGDARYQALLRKMNLPE